MKYPGHETDIDWSFVRLSLFGFLLSQAYFWARFLQRFSFTLFSSEERSEKVVTVQHFPFRSMPLYLFEKALYYERRELLHSLTNLHGRQKNQGPIFSWV